jgi:hypothetical protein
MVKLILPRRRFLFLAPAIVASSSLMPVVLPVREFSQIRRPDPISLINDPWYEPRYTGNVMVDGCRTGYDALNSREVALRKAGRLESAGERIHRTWSTAMRANSQYPDVAQFSSPYGIIIVCGNPWG